MIIIGLTGSIAMGKTAVAAMFRDEGVPVHDADQAVHDLMAAGGMAAEPVGQAFPKAVRDDGSIDRSILGELVFNDGSLRQKLEQILYPLLRIERDQWLDNYRLKEEPIIVLDVPLLFETGGEKDCDVTVLASSSPYLQRRRALSRQNMTSDRFDAILSLQMPDAMKRQKADFVVPTDFGFTASRWYVRRIIEILRGRTNA
jgi:dephospho-CoA kinase